MNNTKQNNNTENENSLSEERQDVTCSEGEAVTELSLSSGSPLTDEEIEYMVNFPQEIEDNFLSKLTKALDLPSDHFDNFYENSEESRERMKILRERVNQVLAE